MEVLILKQGNYLIATWSNPFRSGFARDIVLDDTPQQLAGRILATHAKGTDDALVLVARYLGRTP